MKGKLEKVSTRRLGRALGASHQSIMRWADEGLIAHYQDDSGRPLPVVDYDAKSMTLLRIGAYLSTVLRFTTCAVGCILRRIKSSWVKCSADEHAFFLYDRTDEFAVGTVYVFRCRPSLFESYALAVLQEESLDLSGWDVLEVQAIHEKTLELIERIRSGAVAKKSALKLIMGADVRRGRE